MRIAAILTDSLPKLQLKPWLQCHPWHLKQSGQGTILLDILDKWEQIFVMGTNSISLALPYQNGRANKLTDLARECLEGYDEKEG